ncbi:MAG: ABC transporter ATP-binding protein [Proteobacteria bacterium]|nr:MAG: ABC transporter ATP-binding protein [Pseudomonadota bacterium]
MKVSHLSLNIGSKTLLHDLSFEVPEASLFAILGANGAGKTLLLRALAGLSKASEGTIDSAHAHNLSWVPLSQSLPFDFRVSELVIMGRFAKHQGFPQKSDRLKALEAIKRCGIEELSERNYNSLSRGEQTKVDIARAIASETKLILLDEPFSNLDIDAVLHMTAVFKMLRDEGRTLIFSHHDLFTTRDLASDVLILKKGRVLDFGPLKKVFEASAIERAYNVRAIFHEDEGHQFLRFESSSKKSD